MYLTKENQYCYIGRDWATLCAIREICRGRMVFLCGGLTSTHGRLCHASGRIFVKFKPPRHHRHVTYLDQLAELSLYHRIESGVTLELGLPRSDQQVVVASASVLVVPAFTVVG